jgi:hypothetical protein
MQHSMNGRTCRGGENDLGLETAEGGQPDRDMGSGSATMGIRASCPPFRSLTLTVAPSLRARHLPWTLYDGVTHTCMLSVTTEIEGGHDMRSS